MIGALFAPKNARQFAPFPSISMASTEETIARLHTGQSAMQNIYISISGLMYVAAGHRDRPFSRQRAAPRNRRCRAARAPRGPFSRQNVAN